MLPCRSRHNLLRLRPAARYHSNASTTVGDHLRTLLRETAQPVAVVTALMDPTTEPSQHAHATRFHGATLSSFSSIAMDPHPLIAFSLRIPSRMAIALTAAHASARDLAVHMVINILSASQAPVARRFSRPDLHPTPFVGLPHTLSPDGLPVLDGCVGALSCNLVAASWPLHDKAVLANTGASGNGGGSGRSGERGTGEWRGDGVASELFIAEVIRVERMPEPGVNPLLYHRRGYVSTGTPIPDDTPARTAS